MYPCNEHYKMPIIIITNAVPRSGCKKTINAGININKRVLEHKWDVIPYWQEAYGNSKQETSP